MYRILIFEDTPTDAETLLGHIRRYGEEHGIRFDTHVERSALLLGTESDKADLIFMDIEMPGIDGMDAAGLLRSYDQSTPLIFVTNLAQLAIRGYEVDALDFMVKPVSYGAFSMRMAKALRVLERDSKATLALPAQGGMSVVRLDEIACVESHGHSLSYHLSNGQEIRTRDTLGAAEERLGDSFVRISKGVIVGMRHIRGYHGQEVTLVDGTLLTFGRSMRKAAVERIAAFVGQTWETA